MFPVTRWTWISRRRWGSSIWMRLTAASTRSSSCLPRNRRKLTGRRVPPSTGTAAVPALTTGTNAFLLVSANWPVVCPVMKPSPHWGQSSLTGPRISYGSRPKAAPPVAPPHDELNRYIIKQFEQYSPLIGTDWFKIINLGSKLASVYCPLIG